MRLLGFAAASVVLVGCFVIDPDDPEPPPAKSSSAPAPTETSKPSPAPASTAPAGTCAPNALCGGITSCTDNCYGTDCCSISCSCGKGEDQTHLYCTMTCSK